MLKQQANSNTARLIFDIQSILPYITKRGDRRYHDHVVEYNILVIVQVAYILDVIHRKAFIVHDVKVHVLQISWLNPAVCSLQRKANALVAINQVVINRSEVEGYIVISRDGSQWNFSINGGRFSNEICSINSGCGFKCHGERSVRRREIRKDNHDIHAFIPV